MTLDISKKKIPRNEGKQTSVAANRKKKISIFDNSFILKICNPFALQQCEELMCLTLNIHYNKVLRYFQSKFISFAEILKSRRIYSTFLLRSNYKLQHIHLTTPQCFHLMYLNDHCRVIFLICAHRRVFIQPQSI